MFKGVKTCIKCEKEKPATKTYFKLSVNTRGLNSVCRECFKEDNKKYKYSKKEPVTTWLNGNDEIYI